MQIRVTKVELLEIMSAHFGREITEVVIAKPPAAYEAFLNKLEKEMQIDHLTEAVLFEPHHKIPAIKALRGLVPSYGLGDAKWVIENWMQWSAFFKSKGRIPNIKGSFSDGFKLS